jgi:hypothetical protein
MRSRAVVAVVGRFVLVVLALHVAGCAHRVKKRRVAYLPPVVQTDWPRPEVLDLAMRAWRCGLQEGEFSSPLLTVIDYSLPSTQQRLWVLDVPRHRVLHHELVAHGEGSGDDYAVAFSNIPGSRQSSLGLFRTEWTYNGGSGYSLRLNGLEPGVNDLALERNIVVHGADYVEPDMIAQYGRLGRSWGCPALPREAARSVIEDIKGGSAVFAYYPDAQWLTYSHFLRCEGVGLARR